MLWRIIEWGAIAGLAAGTVYYTLNFGWLGLAYCALAAALGMMIIYYFADIMPILGPYLRRIQHHNDREDQPPSAER